jgi:hypothetical protein
MSEEERTLKDEIRSLKETFERAKKIKPRRFNLPMKARVRKPHLKKGFVIVIQIDDNHNVTFRREPIVDGTIKLDDTYHAISDVAIFFYKGKPMLFQAKKKLNPWSLEGDNETYGQPYVAAKILKDTITPKKFAIKGMIIFWLILGAIAVYYFMSRGGAV